MAPAALSSTVDGLPLVVLWKSCVGMTTMIQYTTLANILSHPPTLLIPLGANAGVWWLTPHVWHFYYFWTSLGSASLCPMGHEQVHRHFSDRVRSLEMRCSGASQIFRATLFEEQVSHGSVKWAAVLLKRGSPFSPAQWSVWNWASHNRANHGGKRANWAEETGQMSRLFGESFTPCINSMRKQLPCQARWG